MRGGVARWKRGVSGTGVRSAVAYALGGSCDASMGAADAAGAIAAARYAGTTVTRHSCIEAGIVRDELDADSLAAWFEGKDPETGETRGRALSSPDNDLVLDATINAPKSFSVACLLHPELAEAYEDLQDRLRDRVIGLWRVELNARRGHAGERREDLARIEVVELKHERSRSLDPHKHRHLWLNTSVLGEDGRWSKVETRVALRFQTVVNAEGDLAARTDPAWTAALAAHGYTLDGAGEIEQLAHLVKPLSRRAAQIEANKKVKLAEWEAAHPGQEASKDVLTGIDRWAWAHGRPGKPGLLDEDEWAGRVRAEVAGLDPEAGRGRRPVRVRAVAVADANRDALAALAVADADRRSTGNGGRFSVFDVRAGAGRAVAASGAVADRAVLQELVEDVAGRAVRAHTVALLAEDGIRVPAHVKGLMAVDTAADKTAVADAFDALAGPGLPVDSQAVAEVSERVLGEGKCLDAGQADAAGAIAGTGRLVTVTGPAGTGKTTMLKVARQMLHGQGRRMVVVAPTKKAASVAGRETGADSSSLHALLHDHGYRWQDGPAGQEWTRLAAGEEDPATGGTWRGPARYTLRAGDRIVVDEAGMVDLKAAAALARIAEETGAGIAMVGDHLQAMPVGHAGAMALMRDRSCLVVELCAVHRFHDPAWAALSLRLRDPGSREEAAQVAQEIVAGGHTVAVSNPEEAREAMAREWFAARAAGQSVSLVTGTHEEAQQISEAIQARRLHEGTLDPAVAVVLQGGQTAYRGDIVQTRRNDTATGVENRQTWVIRTTAGGGAVLDSATQAGVTRTVPAEYLAEHAHLSYATTVHGVQGETADRSLVGPGVDAAGLYVGLTRGRAANRVVVIAGTGAGAAETLAEAMRRGTVEATLEEGRRAAMEDLARAARTVREPDPAGPARWDDRAARPCGGVVDLGQAIRAAEERAGAAHVQEDRLEADRAGLARLDARLAAQDAARRVGMSPAVRRAEDAARASAARRPAAPEAGPVVASRATPRGPRMG